VNRNEVQQWHQGTPADWALESLAIVRTHVYRLPSYGEISASYIESGRAVIRTRLAQAMATASCGCRAFRISGKRKRFLQPAFSSFLLRSIIGVSNEEDKEDRERMRGSKNYHGDCVRD
jgi:hypothetical protein